MLHDRAAAEGAARRPGVPRRPARHRDHRGCWNHQWLSPDRPAAGGPDDRDQRRRVGGHRLRGVDEGDGRAPRQRAAVRHPRGRLPGPREWHEPMEVGACGPDRPAHPGRRARRRGRLPRPVGQGRGRPGDGGSDGRPAADLRHGEPGPGDHARGGPRGAAGGDHRDRPQRLPQPGQQRPGLPLHLPRRARRPGDHHQHGDEGRRRPGAGRTGARGRAGRGRRGLRRQAAALRPGIHHPAPRSTRA